MQESKDVAALPRPSPNAPRAAAERVVLRTPPLPCLVPDGVFDAFGWCASEQLVWRKPIGPIARGEPITADNPPRMAFVFRAGARSVDLPRELAHLHVGALAEEHEWALAPWAIDDATDGLYAARAPAGEVFELAGDRLTALVWGLHDFAHFHNHGPFEERAWTELQCDAAALVWLLINASAIGLSDEAWETARRELADLGRSRFASEEKSFDEAAMSATGLRAIAEALA